MEWSNKFRITDHVAADGDFAYSHTRFRNGGRIPGAVEGVVSAGVSLYDLGHFTGGLRYRYLGPHPPIEGDSVRSAASQMLGADVRFALTPRMRIGDPLTNSWLPRVSTRRKPIRRW